MSETLRQRLVKKFVLTDPRGIVFDDPEPIKESKCPTQKMAKSLEANAGNRSEIVARIRCIFKT